MTASIFALALAVFPTPSNEPATPAPAREALERTVKSALPDLRAFYLETHANPELSLHEEKTAERTAKALEAAGFQVTRKVGGFGVVGVLKNGDGPTILIRGDMDALPVVEETGLEYASTVKTKGKDGADVGVMHACGHDMHQTVLVGTARTLAALKDQWRGTVLAIAQPAEEIGVGAKAMIDDGLFTRFPKPDQAIALHVSNGRLGSLSYASGFAFANVDSVDITIHGRGGHGSRPQDTIDPIVIGSHVVAALQTIVSRRLDPIEPAVVTVGSFHAGSKHNIISDTAKLEITVRSYKEDVRQKILDGIREITINTARAYGAKKDPDVVLRDAEFCPATYNDPKLATHARDLFRSLIGAENVIEEPAMMGGEDFGRYSKELGIPGFMFRLGTISGERLDAYAKEGSGVPSLHSSRYWPDVDPSIELGVKALSSLAIDLLGKP